MWKIIGIKGAIKKSMIVQRSIWPTENLATGRWSCNELFSLICKCRDIPVPEHGKDAADMLFGNSHSWTLTALLSPPCHS